MSAQYKAPVDEPMAPPPLLGHCAGQKPSSSFADEGWVDMVHVENEIGAVDLLKAAVPWPTVAVAVKQDQSTLHLRL